MVFYCPCCYYYQNHSYYCLIYGNRKKANCPAGRSQDSSQTPPTPWPANVLSPPSGCSMRLTAGPSPRPLALGATDLLTVEEGPASAARAPGPLPVSTLVSSLGLTRQGKSKHDGAQGTCTLDVPAFPACSSLLRPSFVQSDWESGARVCHS